MVTDFKSQMTMHGTCIFLGLGTNFDREANLVAALQILDSNLQDLHCSNVYESLAIGDGGEPFLNLVVYARTSMELQELNAWLKLVETACGRRIKDPRNQISIDIDLLLYGDLNGNFDGIELPRADVVNYAFVLRPLSEIAPDHVHPPSGSSYAELWRAMQRDTATGKTLGACALFTSSDRA